MTALISGNTGTGTVIACVSKVAWKAIRSSFTAEESCRKNTSAIRGTRDPVCVGSNSFGGGEELTISVTSVACASNDTEIAANFPCVPDVIVRAKVYESRNNCN